MSRAARERGDIGRATEELEALRGELATLEAEFEDALAAAREDLEPGELECRELLVRARKSDIGVDRIVLAWAPWRVSPDGFAEPAFPVAPRRAEDGH